KKFRGNPDRWAFTPDGRTLIMHDFADKWQAFDTTTGARRDEVKLPDEAPYSRLVIAPDNRTLVVPLKGGVVLWDLKEGRLRHLLSGTAREAMADQHFVGGFAPDGK